MKTYGFIGCGNMGSALAAAAAKAGGELLLADSDPNKAAALAESLGGKAASNNTVAEESDLIFLAVKPQVLPAVLEALAPIFAARKDHFVLVSMAAGATIESIESYCGGQYPLVRIMPNLPAACGAGMILFAPNALVSAQDLADFEAALSPAGKLDRELQRALVCRLPPFALHLLAQVGDLFGRSERTLVPSVWRVVAVLPPVAMLLKRTTGAGIRAYPRVGAVRRGERPRVRAAPRRYLQPLSSPPERNRKALLFWKDCVELHARAVLQLRRIRRDCSGRHCQHCDSAFHLLVSITMKSPHPTSVSRTVSAPRRYFTFTF